MSLSSAQREHTSWTLHTICNHLRFLFSLFESAANWCWVLSYFTNCHSLPRRLTPDTDSALTETEQLMALKTPGTFSTNGEEQQAPNRLRLHTQRDGQVPWAGWSWWGSVWSYIPPAGQSDNLSIYTNVTSHVACCHGSRADTHHSINSRRHVSDHQQGRTPGRQSHVRCKRFVSENS